MWLSLLLMLQVSVSASTDTLVVADSITEQVDTTGFSKAQEIFRHSTPWWLHSKVCKTDIQQLRTDVQRDVPLWYVAIPFLLIASARAFFQREFSEMIQSVMSSNMSRQIFRTQTGSLSAFSVLLLLNFSVVMSIFTYMFLQKQFHFFSVHPLATLLAMNFLFTLFLFVKWLITKTVATLTNFSDVADEFLFQYFAFLKTIGVSTFPLIAVFVIADEKWFAPAFFSSVILLLLLLLLLLVRGLSTSIKVMYSSVYYFFVYVCVMEVLPVLLLTKLLTKTIH